MSKEDFQLSVQIRQDMGKGASRRLRREALIPAIVYGGEKVPQNITISNRVLAKHLKDETFYSQIISLNIVGEIQDVILKDLQRHPARSDVLHADFLRVSKNQKLTMRIPLHFINEVSSTGVKLQGGMVSHNMSELEISCLPADLPEYIEVDLAEMELGQILHISDLQLPPGVEPVNLAHGEDYDLPVVAINKPRSSAIDDDVSEDGESEAESE
jgi:large subunit ribosomal protein L25